MRTKVITLGQLKEIKELRKVLPHKASGFAPRLIGEDNRKLLGDAA